MSETTNDGQSADQLPPVPQATALTKPAAKPVAKRSTRPRLVEDPSTVPSVNALAASIPRDMVPAPKGGFVSGAKPFVFVTEKDSPFSDGYSIAGERAALKDELKLLSADELGYAHPAFDRVMELDKRERQLAHSVTEYQQRNGADVTVNINDARSMQMLGALVASSKDTDTMTLHTKEGLRLFMGRAKDPQKKHEVIHGGTRIGSGAKVMWVLTGTDNPYADWALLRLESSLRTITEILVKETEIGQKQLMAMRERGLNYTVLASQKPQTLQLGFKSPYGFAIAEMIAMYDYYVRVIKSLVHRNLRADEDAYAAIRGVTRTIRGRFSEFARFERCLTYPQCAGLSRADYVLVQTDKTSEAAKAAAARIAAATEIFGPVPAEVFSGAAAPKHSKRRQRLTQHDRALLESVAQHLEDVEQVDPAAVNARVEVEAAAML